MNSVNGDRENIDHPEIFIKELSEHTQANPDLKLVRADSDTKRFDVIQKLRRYQVLRNTVELNALGCNITSDTEQLWKDALTTSQPWGAISVRQHKDDYTMAAEYYEALSHHFTPDLMRTAALAVINAPKNAKNGLPELNDHRLDTYQALQEGLRGPGPHHYRAFGSALDSFSIEQLNHLPPSE